MVPRVSHHSWQSMWEIRPRSSHYETPVVHGRQDPARCIPLLGDAEIPCHLLTLSLLPLPPCRNACFRAVRIAPKLHVGQETRGIITFP